METSHKKAKLALLVIISLVACKRTHVGSSGGGPTAPAWSHVEEMVAAVARSHSVSGLGLAVYDANDKKVYEHMFGDFAPDRRVPVASASKMASGLVFFHLIDKGTLTLDSTTGAVLGALGK